MKLLSKRQFYFIAKGNFDEDGSDLFIYPEIQGIQPCLPGYIEPDSDYTPFKTAYRFDDMTFAEAMSDPDYDDLYEDYKEKFLEKYEDEALSEEDSEWAISNLKDRDLYFDFFKKNINEKN